MTERKNQAERQGVPSMKQMRSSAVASVIVHFFVILRFVAFLFFVMCIYKRKEKENVTAAFGTIYSVLCFKITTIYSGYLVCCEM
jgi:hypothetical protein